MRFGEFLLLIFKTINTILHFCGYMEKSVSWKIYFYTLTSCYYIKCITASWTSSTLIFFSGSCQILVKFGSIWEEFEKNLRVKDQAQLQISEDNIDKNSTVCSNSSSQQRRPNQHAFTILDFVHHIIVAARRRYLRFFSAQEKCVLCNY